MNTFTDKNAPADIRIKRIVPVNLRALLHRTGKRQKDISDSTGIPVSTIHSYFNGRSLPTPGNIQKIADFFEVNKSDIDPRYSNNMLDETKMFKIELNNLNSINTKVYLNGELLTQSEIDDLIKFIEVIHKAKLYDEHDKSNIK